MSEGRSSSSTKRSTTATPAIGFAYLAGYIRKFGYNPVIVDGIGEALNHVWPLGDYPGYSCHGLTFDKIIDRIPSDADVIGFSGMFSGEWPVLRDLITLVKSRFPDALLVAGGEHVTALTEYSLKDCPALDVCVLGEGESTFLEVLETYGNTRSYEGIYGTGYLGANGEYQQPPRPLVRKGESPTDTPRIREIDEIPWPHWPEGHLEKFWEVGKALGISTGRDMPFLVSRGCPYECTFCSNPFMYGTTYRLRDIDDVIAEIKCYIDRYDITSL